MTSPIPTVFGIFLNQSQAALCVERLLGSGFEHEDISLLLPENLGSKDLPHDENSKEGSSTSVVTASVAIGGGVGLLAGLSELAIPGVGPLLAAGPILGALAGFGVGGAVGGVIDAFECIGIPRHLAPDYADHVKKGGLLLTVRCKTSLRVDRAESLLAGAGAEHVTASSGPPAH